MKFSIVYRERGSIPELRPYSSVSPAVTYPVHFAIPIIKTGTLMSNEAIIEQISRFPAASLSYRRRTSLFIDKEFIDQLHEAGFRVHIETNGTHTIPGNIDWITCSPKIDCQEEKNVPLLLQEADELKVSIPETKSRHTE